MKSREANLDALRKRLKTAASPERAKSSARFFKTGPGDYAEGDQFLGITVPKLRQLARGCVSLSQTDVLALLRSPFHEERFLALLLLIERFRKGKEETQKQIYELYLTHTKFVNNWDLVDTSAPPIVGGFLSTQPTKTIQARLLELASSPLLWERRIAMIATLHWIRQGDPHYGLIIAQALLNDRHDLLQKAVGWMLREIGKHCGKEWLEAFLTKHISTMGRTTLRYAIEHFPERIRQSYLKAA
ncbi:DNA alkylation repair protein [Patescibacteria group bacterium]|nr:DNA alkylation repair protein [Patescibacteria group bacterium]